MEQRDLKYRLQEYLDIKRRQIELKAEHDRLENELKAFMGEREELTEDGIKVRWTRYTDRRFDTAAFKEEHPSLYEQYVRQKECRRFSVG
jgi:predicted phage-related endonuclease